MSGEYLSLAKLSWQGDWKCCQLHSRTFPMKGLWLLPDDRLVKSRFLKSQLRYNPLLTYKGCTD